MSLVIKRKKSKLAHLRDGRYMWTWHPYKRPVMKPSVKRLFLSSWYSPRGRKFGQKAMQRMMMLKWKFKRPRLKFAHYARCIVPRLRLSTWSFTDDVH